MTSFRYYKQLQSTMAATNKEIQGNLLLHQELCGQHDQEMHQHQNLEGLPWDGGGIRQELLQRKLMKERWSSSTTPGRSLPMGVSSVRRTKRLKELKKKMIKRKISCITLQPLQLHCIYLYCDHVYASRTSFVFWSALTLIYFRIIHVE